eukprot:TRINITY_DN6556_c0_g1_i2.p2 TRINITY_DN6556_c0_g1~~TRINITY_DN6556_c0_g1_i2.p2  ORF type:complete len:389 (+),score=64.96 TRINITY_DN6556_c0_g1_i2:133-1299(+)
MDPMISPIISLKSEPDPNTPNNRPFVVVHATTPPPRVHKACANCKKSHHACDNERPCRRCIDRGMHCFDTEPKKRGRRKMSGGQLPEVNEATLSPPSVPVKQYNQTSPTNQMTHMNHLTHTNQPSQMNQMGQVNQLNAMHYPPNTVLAVANPSLAQHVPMGYTSQINPQMPPSVTSDGTLTQLMANSDPQLDNMFDILFSSLIDDSSRLAKKINTGLDQHGQPAKEGILDIYYVESLEDVFEKVGALVSIRCPEYAPVIMLQKEWIDSPQVRAKFKEHSTAQNLAKQRSYFAYILSKWVETFKSLGVPAIIWERTELIHFYNDAYRQVTGYNRATPTQLFDCGILRQMSESSKMVYLSVMKKLFCEAVDTMVMPCEIKNFLLSHRGSF